MLAIEDAAASERSKHAAPRLLTEYMLATGVETGAEWAAKGRLPEILFRECADVEQTYAPPGAFWVAFDGEDSVGCAGLRRLTAERHELRRLWVQPAHRGVGLGSQLVAKCLSHSRASGAMEVVLDVVPSRTRAIEWYRRMGFEETGPFEESPFEMVYLRKVL